MNVYKHHSSDKTTLKKSFKLDYNVGVEKRQTASLILEDYYYDNLNMKHTILESFESEYKNKPITSAKYTILVLCAHQNEHKKAFGRSPPYQEYNARKICLVPLVLFLIASREGLSRQEYLAMHRMDLT